MKRTYWLSAAAGMFALGAFSLAAEAAPIGGAAAGVNAGAGDNALVQDVAWGRRCWRHHGRLHCRRVYHRYGYYGDGVYRGYGYGPSIGLYFGHNHRHHRHHWHHR